MIPCRQGGCSNAPFLHRPNRGSFFNVTASLVAGELTDDLPMCDAEETGSLLEENPRLVFSCDRKSLSPLALGLQPIPGLPTPLLLHHPLLSSPLLLSSFLLLSSSLLLSSNSSRLAWSRSVSATLHSGSHPDPTSRLAISRALMGYASASPTLSAVCNPSSRSGRDLGSMHTVNKCTTVWCPPCSHWHSGAPWNPGTPTRCRNAREPM